VQGVGKACFARQLGDGAVEANGAVHEGDDPIRNGLELVEPVARQQHGHALSRGRPQELPDGRGGHGVEGASRLVEDQERWPSEHGPGDRKSRPHPRGVAEHQLVPAGESRTASAARTDASSIRRPCRHRRTRGSAAREAPQRASSRRCGWRTARSAVTLNLPTGRTARGVEERRDDLDERRLAGPFGPTRPTTLPRRREPAPASTDADLTVVAAVRSAANRPW
jgi:hypothetical protein